MTGKSPSSEGADALVASGGMRRPQQIRAIKMASVFLTDALNGNRFERADVSNRPQLRGTDFN